MSLVTDPAIVVPWVWEKIGDEVAPTKGVTGIGRLYKGRVVAGTLYMNFTGESVLAHIACDTRQGLTRDYIETIFDYPFVQLGVQKVYVTVISDNIRAIRLAEGLGFKKEAVLVGAYPEGKDQIYYALTRDNCKWLRGHNSG